MVGGGPVAAILPRATEGFSQKEPARRHETIERLAPGTSSRRRPGRMDAAGRCVRSACWCRSTASGTASLGPDPRRRSPSRSPRSTQTSLRPARGSQTPSLRPWHSPRYRRSATQTLSARFLLESAFASKDSSNDRGLAGGGHENAELLVPEPLRRRGSDLGGLGRHLCLPASMS